MAIMTAEKSCRHPEGHGNGKHGCEVQHRVAGHVLLVHSLIISSRFGRGDDHGCDVGSEGDANVQRNIFELDGGRPQPLPQGPRKQLERRG